MKSPMTIKDRQTTLVYRLIEKLWGNGLLMAFQDLVSEQEKSDETTN